jgi:hypothetical protein
MKINDSVTIEGRIVGIWESKSDSPVSLRKEPGNTSISVRIEQKDKTTIDTNITNVREVEE